MPDLINSLFELFGAVAVLDHCRQLYGAKRWEGVSWMATMFFFTWGVWNLYYYPHLGQTLSFIAGIMITVSNSLWLYLLWKYRNN